ncbi:uncharacterized protein CBL_03173 [Carabus blaptoides fortunei]
MKSLVFLLILAACSKYPKEFYSIVAGATKLSDGGDVYQVLTIVYHEDWARPSNLHDIGLLLTDNDIQFGDQVKAMLPEDEEVPIGKKLFLTGWGLTSYPGKISDHLKFIALTSISQETCAAAWSPTLVFDSQLCTYNRVGEGACTYDSGGPLVYNDRVVGIVSFGKACAIGKPDVFTKVSSYVLWIYIKIQENERKANIN